MPHQWGTFSTYHHLVVTGGSSHKDVKTIEFGPDQSLIVGILPSLPKKKMGHCIVALDADELFITGKKLAVLVPN